MIFSTPLALVLLVAVPLVVYLGYPRYRFRRVRDSISTVLRVVIMLLLVLAVAGLQIAKSADRLAVVFLVDVSDSMGPDARQAQLDYMRQALKSMGPDDEAGIVVFGANAVVERPMSNVHELEAIRSTPLTNNSNLGGAFWLGLSMFPSDSARRMVVLTDGRPTIGDAEAAAERAAAEHVEITYVPYVRPPSPEVQVTDLRVPNTVSAGQQFDLNLTIDSQADTPATITVYDSGSIIHREDVNLHKGTTSYTLTLQSASGFKDFQVRVDPKGADSFYQNNQLSAFTRVVGPPRVLLVSSSADDSQYILKALQDQGITVDSAAPSDLPIGVASLAQYQSVVLVNVPAADLSTRRMETLQSYVKDLGGGLVVVGGPDAYGPGGYYQTPLEAALPVDMQIKDQKRLPQLTIAYVIDRSGSMGALSPSGVAAIDLAKEAMIRSINFLQPTDRAAVVSFDTVGYWIAPFQPVVNREPLQRLIATLRPGGGTDILAGMQLTANEIVKEPSDRKHIILLTDGGASPQGLVELTKDLHDNHNTTTSVIAIGSGIPPFLADMAKAGGGNFHQVTDVDSIPAIFASETVLATRSYIIEDPFTPTVTATNPIMDGITSSPQLLGYVATTPKLASQVVLRGPQPFSDPILAAWQYGLGRSVAFTSDATARWGKNWVSWNQFAQFWSQAVRWTITEGTTNNVEARVVMDNGQAHVIVDARDSSGAFLNGLNLQLSLIDPNLQAVTVPLTQVAPGQYEGTFTPGTEGAYFMRLTGSSPDSSQTIQTTTGWVMSYSPEYQSVNVGAANDGERLLSSLAGLTGGGSIADDPGKAFAHTLTADTASAPIWHWLVIAAMLLLPIDIAVRRLVVNRSDFQRLAARTRAFVFRPRTGASLSSERMTTLMDARERARQRAEQQASNVSASTISALRNRHEEARLAAPPSSSPEFEGGREGVPAGGEVREKVAAPAVTPSETRAAAPVVAPTAPPVSSPAGGGGREGVAAPAPDKPRWTETLPHKRTAEDEEAASDNVAGRLLKRKKGREKED